MRTLCLAFACVLVPPRPLPEPSERGELAFYVDPETQRVDLAHPLPLKPLVCGGSKIEALRGWYSIEERMIRLCNGGESIPLEGSYGVVIGRVSR